MANGFVVGDYIWAKPVSAGEFNIEVGGKIVGIESSRIKIRDDDGVDISISPTQVLKNMHITSINGVDDMINLGDLQEYAILRNLHKRYKEKKIYTYTGSMLVAINPYELLPIYTNALIQEYQEKATEELPPHIFSVGDNSYKHMIETKNNQCIVISGESGAGKTESTKLILQYLAATSGKHSWVEQQILEANPILEAFGNAKTVRNDNSSRFGKYIDISFNRNGNIEGAKIEQYLLEKSRIVSQNEGERNYHIFYSMVAGLSKDEKKKLDLSDADNYNFLKGGRTLTCQGRNEVSEFADIRAALKVLNFSEKETWDIFTLLAAILHLGNLKFKSGSVSNTESSEIGDSSLNEKISKLLGVNKYDLGEALTKKTIFAHGDKVVSHLSKEQASDSRNAFVKGIYGRLFIKLVDKINAAISQSKTPSKRSIGVLDIFGFENFKVNSFEQLCINYANENLQQFFVKHIFKLEQEYYTKEGIAWHNISFIDNQETLDMLGMKPMNCLSLIDEESKFPKGTDFSMLAKLHNQHGSRPMYLKPKSDLTPAFGIAHFAGNVFYDVPGFLEKNRDSFSQDLKNLIHGTEQEMLKAIFEGDLEQEANTKRMVTLASQFRTSLDTLMKTLGSCHPFFVRCIKPNEDKKPQVFDRALCCRQLRYSGMMETAKIRQAGYPIRYTFKEFVDRFRHLGKAIPPSSKGDCKASTARICTNVFTNNENYQLGNTKLFMKHADNEYLEELRKEVLAKHILVLQKAIKGWIYRRRFVRLRAAALVFQKYFRARGLRTRFLKIRHGYQRLQACIRRRQLESQFRQIRRNMLGLQTRCRGYIARTKSKCGLVCAMVRERRANERKFKQEGRKNYVREAEVIMQHKMAELDKEYMIKLKAEEEERMRANEMVEGLFDFLDQSSAANTPTDVQSNQAFLESLQMKSLDSGPVQLDPLTEYNFRKYAATYFTGNISHQYSKKPLKESLHELPTPDDVLAAQALWITILRFMGDYPEPRYEDTQNDNLPVMARVQETLSRSFANRKEYKEILRQEKKMATMKKSDRQKVISMTLKRKNKLLEDVKQGLVEDNFASENYKEWLHNRRTTNLEKIHFIIGHGILRPELRDEIFCQICKQLTNNYTKSSFARGWILLSLCVGCFPPSDRFVNYLRSFMRAGPSSYGPYCEGRLNRTFKNGARTQPPSYLELKATKDKEPINLDVTLMDGTIQNLEIDSASTAEEVCNEIASKINMTDSFGFSLFIAIFDKVMSLGSESDHIMDAVSQCEQYSKEQGQSEKNTPWRLFVRKEIFTPWHDPSADPVATNLIYHQVVRGIKAGEYRCNAEEDILCLIATKYYIDNGADMNPKVLHTRIGEYLPTYMVTNVESKLDDLEKKIIHTFKNLNLVKKKKDPIKAKEFIVKYTKTTWPILFSKFYEAIQISGPPLPKKNMIIAINWTGIYMIDEHEEILLELTFADIFFVTFERAPQALKLMLTTVRKEEYVFHSLDAQNLCNLIQYMLDELRKRSIYCVATQDYKHDTNNESFITFKKGDLITLTSGATGEQIMTSTWGTGECNGSTGNFPTENVCILPTLNRPPEDILVAFKKDGIVGNTATTNVLNTVQRLKLYTLAHYADEHFRKSRRTTVTKTSVLTTARRTDNEDLWKYSNEPIYQPLLQKVLDNQDASKEACAAFTAILKYMGDLPAPKEKYSNEYTDQIFVGACKHDILKDEIYCQIMKQLTFNRLSRSEERGWELMYLLTGLFAPSGALYTELQKFLKSRTHPFVERCLTRLQKIQKVGPRRFPPYSIEVEAIQHRSMEIFHKIYFPDDTDEAFEIEATTKANDLAKNIAQRLDLETTDGFSLFVAITDKVFSIPENAFFYDFLSELINYIRATKPSWGSAAPLQTQYQIFFMKKLWVNVVPGKFPNADEIFYYHQELPKYLKGYHKCSKQDAIKLAALIARVKFGPNPTEVQEALKEHGLRDVIPDDLIKAASSSEWRKSILNEFKNVTHLSIEAAKTQFLKTIYAWPTFGSTFFEVKQTTEPTFPEMINIAINRKGVNIIHPQTKDILKIYEYQDLNNWSSGNTFFHLTIGNIMRKTKLLCETSLGYKMDDLITSYTDFIRASKEQKHQSKFLL